MVDLASQESQDLMPIPVQFTELTSEDLKDPTLAALNQQLKIFAQALNGQMGFNGPIQVAAPLDLQGNTIKNAGAAVDGSDVVIKSQADQNYGPAAVAPQLEATGNKILQTTRRLNDTTQREQSTTYLNDLLSAAPKSNTINPIVSGSSVLIPSSFFQFADGSRKAYPARTDVVQPVVNYSISSWSVTSGVATVTLSSTPSPALTVGMVVGISGTAAGGINGSAEITNIVSPTEFQFSTAGTGSGASGTVAVGGTYYYYVERSIPVVQFQSIASGVDTPSERLSISGDKKQLVAVVQVGAGGVSAGGGTPTNVSNAGAMF